MIVNGHQNLGLIGCGEWSVLKQRLALLLEQAQAKGITGSNAYVAAKRYYDDNSGIFGSPVVLLGSHCESEVREINDRIAKLSAELSSSGTSPVVVGPEVQPPDGNELTGMVKWVIGGVIAVAVAWTVGTIVPRLFRKKKGYGDPWDPEQRDLEGYSKRRRRRRRARKRR